MRPTTTPALALCALLTACTSVADDSPGFAQNAGSGGARLGQGGAGGDRSPLDDTGSGGSAFADAGSGGMVGSGGFGGGAGGVGGAVVATDRDGDGVPDELDPCPLDHLDDEDHDGLCGDADPDLCPLGDADADNDGWADACDVVLLSYQSGVHRFNAADAMAVGLGFEIKGDEHNPVTIRPDALSSSIEVERIAVIAKADQERLGNTVGYVSVKGFFPDMSPLGSTLGTTGENYDLSGATPVRVVSRGYGADGELSATVELRGYRLN